MNNSCSAKVLGVEKTISKTIKLTELGNVFNFFSKNLFC